MLSTLPRARSAPMVSIVLPVFNRLPFLRASVDSVFAQTFRDWELIIVDDGSGVETQGYLSLLERSHHITLITVPHTGNPATVRNTGLRAACGEYVAFVDSDDVWLPRKLEVQVAELRSQAACRWSYTAFVAVDEWLNPLDGARGEPKRGPSGWILDRLVTMDAVIALPSVLVKRELIQKASGFDERQRMCEDYDLWLRLAALSQVHAIDDPFVLVRRHQQHSGDDVGAYQGMLQAIEKLRRSGSAGSLDPVLRRRRALTAAHLALSQAACGRRLTALRTLTSSVGYSWRYRGWWCGAAAAAARAFVPRSLRAAIRGLLPE